MSRLKFIILNDNWRWPESTHARASKNMHNLYACWVIFHGSVIIFKINAFKKYFRNTFKVSDGLDPDCRS